MSRQGARGRQRSGSPCEACGGVVGHHGGFEVGRRLNGAARLVHNLHECRRKWQRHEARIRAGWVEARVTKVGRTREYIVAPAAPTATTLTEEVKMAGHSRAGHRASWSLHEGWIRTQLFHDKANVYGQRGGAIKLLQELLRVAPSLKNANVGGFYSMLARVRAMRTEDSVAWPRVAPMVSAPAPVVPAVSVASAPSTPLPAVKAKPATNGHASPPTSEEGHALVGLVTAGAVMLHASKKDAILRELWELMKQDLA